MFRTVINTLGVAAVLAAPVMGAEWLTDFDAAKAKAAAEGKAVLINFTGSDWCGYCMRMKYTVLDDAAFLDYVKDKFVLLEIDLPRYKEIDPALKDKRQELCKAYNVTGFPTFAIVSETGEVLGGFSGARPDVESTKIFLENALVRRQMLADARKLQGPARAAALLEVYKDFPKTFKNAAAALRVEIAQHDPADSTGMQQQAAADSQMQELTAELMQYGSHDYQGKARVFDAYLSQAHPLNHDRILERKRAAVVFPCLNIMLLNAKTVDDIQAARAYVLKEAQTCYPAAMRAEMIQALEKQFENPQKLLEEIKRRKR